jgi:hypothetical protein
LAVSPSPLLAGFFASRSANSFPRLLWAFTQVKWIVQLSFSSSLIHSLICSIRFW